MIDYLSYIDEWNSNHIPFAIARVTKTWGSAPRPVGSIMLVNKNGDMAGSVSGGCVEGAVVKESKSVIENWKSKKLDYGVSDEDAWSVGLSCGGSIQVFVQTFSGEDTLTAELLACIESNKPCVWVSSLEDRNSDNTLLIFEKEEVRQVGDYLTSELMNQALKAYNERGSRTIEVENKTYLIQIFPPKAQLIIIGAAHITVDLVALGHMYGFETIVIDPRGTFADKTLFNVPPDRIEKAYPSEVLDQFRLDAHTYCAILSHDPKIDDNALEILLPSKVAYIGALGSRKTHAKRVARLEEKGVSKEWIERIKAPIGLSINAKSAKEIAFSVMGEILQEKNRYL